MLGETNTYTSYLLLPLPRTSYCPGWVGVRSMHLVWLECRQTLLRPPRLPTSYLLPAYLYLAHPDR